MYDYTNKYYGKTIKQLMDTYWHRNYKHKDYKKISYAKMKGTISKKEVRKLMEV